MDHVRYLNLFVFVSFHNMVSFKHKENNELPKWVVCCCDLFFWSSYNDFHQKSDMTGHAVFCLILHFPMKTNEKQKNWRQTASQAASLRAHFWSSYKDFHQKSGLPGALGLPGQFSLWFLIKNNKEISSRELWVLQVNFPYGFLLKTIRRYLPGSSGSSRSIFLMVSY